MHHVACFSDAAIEILQARLLLHVPVPIMNLVKTPFGNGIKLQSGSREKGRALFVCARETGYEPPVGLSEIPIRVLNSSARFTIRACSFWNDTATA